MRHGALLSPLLQHAGNCRLRLHRESKMLCGWTTRAREVPLRAQKAVRCVASIKAWTSTSRACQTSAHSRTFATASTYHNPPTSQLIVSQIAWTILLDASPRYRTSASVRVIAYWRARRALAWSRSSSANLRRVIGTNSYWPISWAASAGTGRPLCRPPLHHSRPPSWTPRSGFVRPLLCIVIVRGG